MAALRLMDIDMPRHRVNVDQAVTEVGKQLVYGTPKNHSRRRVPFPAFLAPTLAAHTVGEKGSEIVFTAPEGGPLTNCNWRRRKFEAAMTKLLEAHPELIRLAPLDLRHSAAPLEISAGANVKAVRKMLGNALSAMTLDVYADLFDDYLDAVGNALSEAGDPSVVGKMWTENTSSTLMAVKVR